jgi:hypothetical protein
MITHKNIIVYILLLFTISISAQQIDSVYNFPIKPGMPEWKEFKTHSEMLKVIQLPTNLLNSISTSSLVQTCLNYPLFSDMWAYDNIKEGFEQLQKDFNGFDELINRKDALEELLKYYKKIEPNVINEKSSLLDKGKYTARFCKVEIILAQPELQNNSTQDMIKLLLKEIVNKHEKMLDHHEFDIRSMETNVFAMGNILYVTDVSMRLRISKDEKANNFINTSRAIDKDIILTIVSLSKEYLNN